MTTKDQLTTSTAIPAQAARGPAPAKKSAGKAANSDFGAKMKEAKAKKAAERAAAASNPAPADEAKLPLEDDQAITVYDELLDLTRGTDRGFASQSIRENDKDYLRRMFGVIAKATIPEGQDDPFDSMSAEAQDYYNATVQKVQDGEDWTPPPGFVSKFGKKADKPAAGAKGEKAPKVAKEKAPPKVRAPGVSVAVRTMVLKHPSWTVDDLKAGLVKAGHIVKDATVTTLRSDVNATLAVMRSLKLID